MKFVSSALQVVVGCGLVGLVVAGCGSGGGSPADSTSGTPDAGIVVMYEAAGGDLALAAEEKLLRERRVLEEFRDRVNGFVKLPRGVKTIAKSCGESNAFYDSEQPAIELCYELSQTEHALFAKIEQDPREIDERVYQSSVATLYHELGHALIDLFDLPATGREEDVADQLAAFVLTEDDDSKELLLTAAKSYELSAVRSGDLKDKDLADSHSLDRQRSINMLCYLYGSDQKAFQYLVDDGALDADRAPECPAEYDRMVHAWGSLLRPYLR